MSDNSLLPLVIYKKSFEFFIENYNSDYTIKVEYDIIKCHKSILKKIDYFNSLFYK